MRIRAGTCLATCIWLVAACEQAADDRKRGDEAIPPASMGPSYATEAASNPLKTAWFGDLHVHTTNSLDAYSVGVRATPDDAYRYARGEAVEHPLGYSVRLQGAPLDFYAVTDHAENLGIAAAINDPDNPLASHPLVKQLHGNDSGESFAARMALAAPQLWGEPFPIPEVIPVIRSTWRANIEAAERHNRPGRFTTFIGFEYSPQPAGANMHRNVIFAGSRVPEMPFSAADSINPEDLWNWLDANRADGIEALAIPHNPNWSQGLMFGRNDSAGDPIDAGYAEQRSRNEPLVEVTQVKGTSETHPALSPTDEWADFGIWKMSTFIFTEDGVLSRSEGATTGAYARDALRTGLELQQTVGANPYRFGMIGSTDGHNAASPVEEDRFFGKLGSNDGSPEARGSVPRGTPAPNGASGRDILDFGASGLAGVWAEENSRASIFAALKRREAFATTGPRLQLRFFAGYGYPDMLGATQQALALAYAGGVPMGGELDARPGTEPRFFVWALHDPDEAWLQRAQIVKGWIEGGKSREAVFDVACSDGLAPDPDTHRCPDNGATVNLKDCSTTPDAGAVELKAVWRDPAFDPGQHAFYYLRVLQNPTCRWSTWDAIRAGVAPSSKVAATHQERAWSSPIWIAPMAQNPT